MFSLHGLSQISHDIPLDPQAVNLKIANLDFCKRVAGCKSCAPMGPVRSPGYDFLIDRHMGYIYIYICRTGFNVELDLMNIKIWIFEGRLEVKLPTTWTDEKQRWEESEKRREEKKKEDQRRDSQKKEDPGARKDTKVAKHCVFPMICGSRGLKSRLAKAAGAEKSGQMIDEKLHAAAARSSCASEKK